ncbi:FadR family transcriptional regulator [Tessaracoccus rhinocerotis]|uniref:FadR family transcriptional regulator n=1 Tax=Tessaracoccus rhinocerotis TaxID=1689449 RepID=A0A553K677_9ACTN|nr:FadR/GntR family transcriptional regulator [Tessaracoccus rhinocerotis]TRY20213.1 FadR family transcriptional regulator [Tessaracoccus rhinocerotis]
MNTSKHDASARERRVTRMGSGLHGQIVNTLGQEIIDGSAATGSLMNADELVERFGVSRSVVREALRTLGSLGLVEARPQVGTRVLPPEAWDLLSPQVVTWRARGLQYESQLRELLELRHGVESSAAELAARRASDESGTQLVELAAHMRAAFEAGNADQFYAHDAEFHRLVLKSAGNIVIAQLAETISAAFNARRNNRSSPGAHTVSAEAVAQHEELANAIRGRDERGANQAVRDLVLHSIRELEDQQEVTRRLSAALQAARDARAEAR